MGDLMVFDFYTAEAFAGFIACGLVIYGVVRLEKRFPHQFDRFINLTKWLPFLFLLSMCSMQTGQLLRYHDKEKQQEGK